MVNIATENQEAMEVDRAEVGESNSREIRNPLDTLAFTVNEVLTHCTKDMVYKLFLEAYRNDKTITLQDLVSTICVSVHKNERGEEGSEQAEKFINTMFERAFEPMEKTPEE